MSQAVRTPRGTSLTGPQHGPQGSDATGPAQSTRWRHAARQWLPRGRHLSDDRWAKRHRAMVWVLVLHLPALWALGVASQRGVPHTTGEVLVLGLGTLAAAAPALSRRVRMLAAVVTLLSCSALLVHLTNGLVESHFHFFVVVALITLYQEWLPFVVACVYVLLHHGVVGVLLPREVYNHQAAWDHPVRWAFIHGGFILVASLVNLAAWRFAEQERESLEQVLEATGDGIYGVDAAGRITFVNPVLCDLLGLTPDALPGTDHHLALDHGLAPGIFVERANCPLCMLPEDADASFGEASLGAHRDDGGFQVEFVVRAMSTRSSGRGHVITVRDLRERRALEAERDQLASIAEAAPDLALVGRSDGTLVWMNSAGRNLLGFSRTEDIGHYRIEDLFTAEEMARIYAEDMPKLSLEADWRGEWTLRTRAGVPVPASVSQHLHPGVGGEPAYVSGIMRDLRPQRAEEHERRSGERRLATAEGVARLGSWEWDMRSNVVLWSPGMYRLHGLEPGSGVENVEVWAMTAHPEDREMALSEVEQARETANGLDFVYRAVLGNGRELVIQSRGEMIGDERGSMIGTLLDITERHAAAEALRKSEQQARLVVETAGDAYVQFGSDGRITEWNGQAAATFGWTKHEVIGLEFPPLVLAFSDRESFEHRVGLRDLPGPGQPTGERFELTMLTRSGREVAVEATAWTIETEGEPLISCFIRDIGDRNAAERAKNEFVSVVGHELRTPLTSIHAALALLRAGLLGALNERGQHMVDIAAHNTDRLVRLINDILDIERLTSGTTTLQVQQCDLAALAMRSVEAMRPMAEGVDVTLEVEVEPSLVQADPDRIEQTLTNLLSNAIKFSPAGSTVAVLVRIDPAEATVEVRDQGRGIPTEALELVFDRFQQVDGSDAREKGGTGLGLAICRTIVEQHGGRIWAEDSPGAGATLVFTLPVAAAAELPGGAGSWVRHDDLAVPESGTATATRQAEEGTGG